MTIDRDALVEKIARAIFARMMARAEFPDGDPFDDPAYSYTRNACLEDAHAALDAILPDVQADAWDEGYEARVLQVETEQRYDTSNPYRKDLKS